MSEERDSQLSAMFDGALPDAECELLARRLGRDTALRRQWERYALIGAAIRAEPGVRLNLRIAGRVSVAIAAEASHEEADAAAPSPAVTARPAARGVRWGRPALGAAVAAGVAAMSIFWLRAQSPEPGAPLLATASAPVSAGSGTVVAPRATDADATTPSQSTESESYVVPPASEPLGAAPPAALASYFVVHSQVATPIMSQWSRSRLLMDAESPRDPDADARESQNDGR